MTSYNGSAEFKAQFVALMKDHRAHDHLQQGTFGGWMVAGAEFQFADERFSSEDTDVRKTDGAVWRSCAVGCGYHSYLVLTKGAAAYQNYPRIIELAEGLGVPEDLIAEQELLFERMSEVDALGWPVQFAEALPVGVPREKMAAMLCDYANQTHGAHPNKRATLLLQMLREVDKC